MLFLFRPEIHFNLDPQDGLKEASRLTDQVRAAINFCMAELERGTGRLRLQSWEDAERARHRYVPTHKLDFISNDDLVLASAKLLQAEHNGQVVLLTNDHGLFAKATANGIHALDRRFFPCCDSDVAGLQTEVAKLRPVQHTIVDIEMDIPPEHDFRKFCICSRFPAAHPRHDDDFACEPEHLRANDWSGGTTLPTSHLSAVCMVVDPVPSHSPPPATNKKVRLCICPDFPAAHLLSDHTK